MPINVVLRTGEANPNNVRLRDGSVIAFAGATGVFTVAGNAAQTLQLDSASTGLKTSLVSYWKHDEVSGTRVDSFDSNDLSDNNSTGSATGIINTAASFVAASSNYLSHVSNASLQMSSNTNFTISVWVKLTSLPAASAFYNIIAKDSNAGNARDYSVSLGGSASGIVGFYFFFESSGTNYIAKVNSMPSTGVWYHLVGWYDSGNGQGHLRVNDAATYDSASGATGPDSSSSPFRIGAGAFTGFESYLDGLVDEAGIWKRLLTASEITNLYNSGAGLPYSSFDGGLFTITGNAASPVFIVAGGTGVFTITGSAAQTLELATALTGAFTVTGNAGLPVFIVPAATGTFTVTGGVAQTLELASATTGAFTVTGGAAQTLKLATASTGVFAVTGGAAQTLELATASTGAFTVTGSAAFAVFIIPATTGTFTLTGGDADIIEDELAGTGTFTLTGGTAQTLELATALTGVFLVTGGNADYLIGGGDVAGETGVFIFTGNAAYYKLIVPQPKIRSDVDGAGTSRKLSYFEEQYLIKEHQKADDMEVVRVLTEFLSRI